MRAARVSPIVLVCAISVATSGCYLSHERGDSPRVDAGRRDGGAREDAAPPRSDAGTDGGVDALPCEWRSGEAIPITESMRDESLNALHWTGERYLVAWRTSNDPAMDGRAFARPLRADGRPEGEASPIFGPAAGSVIGGVSVGGDAPALGAIAWDSSQGCRFVRLSTRGSAVGETRSPTERRCTTLAGEDDGFSLFTEAAHEGPRALLRVGPSGEALSRGPALSIFEGSFWWSSARFNDGSQLVVAMRAGVEPDELWGQHIDRFGEPVTMETRIRAFDRAASRVSTAPTRHGALAAWLEGDEDASQRRTLAFLPLERDGTPSGPVRPLAAPTFYRDAGHSLASFEDTILSVAVEDVGEEGTGRQTRLWLHVLDSTGAPTGPPVPLMEPEEFVRRPIVRANPRGALVAYQAAGPGTFRTQIYVRELRCVR